MDEQMTPDGDADAESRGHRATTDEGGFVLPWFALMLLVLIAMAGFGVDVWSWWYTAQKTQRAADAGALAGVVFMPGDPATATSTALFTVNNNGYPDSAASVAVGVKPNQLVVTISQTVNNSFTSLLGLATTTISRSATAEFNEPVKMGSPQAHIANDPEHPPVDQHWLNIGAPRINKQTGDRYADYANCSGAFACVGGVNDEYLDSTYVFTVEVPPGSPNIDIQVYDPEYANGGTTCNQNWAGLTPANINGLMTSFPQKFPASDNPLNRYNTGASMWCTGDDNTSLGTPQATAWLVRGPTGNQFQPLTNDVLPAGGIAGSGPGASGSCTKQFKGYNSDFYTLLNPDPANPSFDPDFYASFHRWYTLCTITGAPPGRYFVQVRSNVPLQGTPSITNLTQPEDPPQDSDLAGQNRYSIRAVTSGTNSYATGVTVYAQEHLPIYSNVLNNASQTPQFYLARLVPGGGASGRILQLTFYDIGDVGGGTTTITVSPPNDMSGSPPTCTWTANNGAAMPTSGSIGGPGGCTVSGITSTAYPTGFNGTLIRADIKVFGDYNCTTADPFGCWFRIQMSYTSGAQANDTTTWDANIGGDPVRLVK
ncbi:MAG: hypothetical protein QOD38_830 [Acidimicrobiaceae bacterium]|jgi:hypothetical protein